jgi:hypothetical protein
MRLIIALVACITMSASVNARLADLNVCWKIAEIYQYIATERLKGAPRDSSIQFMANRYMGVISPSTAKEIVDNVYDDLSYKSPQEVHKIVLQLCLK